GDDVARLSRPFPSALDAPVEYYAAAVGTVRYVGEPVAVVVARDRYVAEDAAELVAVEYEPLPVAAGPDEALAPAAPLLPPACGGCFGGKSSVCAYVVLLALASRHLGVPVRWTEDRVEHLLASSMATERLTEVEAGFSAEGELVALRLDLVDDVGAYVRAPEPATLYRMHGCLAGPYRTAPVEVRSRVVVT